MHGFKIFGGNEIDDIGRYVRDYVNIHPEATVHMGTDSIKNRKFATVICFHFAGKGVHYVFKRFQLEPIRDIRLKILKEASYTMELAEYVEPYMDKYKKTHNILPEHKAIVLHVDVNPKECWGSNKAFREVSGWFIGSGYDTRTKPYSWAATCAADFLCK